MPKKSKNPEGKIKCPQCKELVEKELQFCPECGKRIPKHLRWTQN